MKLIDINKNIFLLSNINSYTEDKNQVKKLPDK